MKLPILMSLTLAFAAKTFAAEPEADEAAELAKKLNNPISNLISVPFQSNWDFKMGPTNEGYKYTLNIQPVIPISIGKDWNLILRTILPVISQTDVYYVDVPPFPGVPKKILDQYPPSERGAVENAGRKLYNQAVRNHPQNRSQSGLGNTTQSFFLSPKEPWNGIIWGVGPVGYYPTATNSQLGPEKWGLGPTFVVLAQPGNWTIGMLANQIWSLGGDSNEQNINAAYLQPFINYTTKTHTSFIVNTESTYDWENSQWTVPINVSIQQVFKIGAQPMALQLGWRYYATSPSGGPEWGIRVNLTFLFPTGKHEAPEAPSPK